MKLNIIRNSVKGSALFLGMAMLLCGCQREEFASMEYAQSDAVVRFSPSIANTGIITRAQSSASVQHGTIASDDGAVRIPMTYGTVEGIGHSIATRGELINEFGPGPIAFATDESFVVKAWDATTLENFIPGSATGAYQEVTYSTGTSLWSTSQEYLWEKGESKTFYAYSNLPASGATVANASAANQTLTYAVPTTASAQKDILMGCCTSDGKSGNPLVMTGTAAILFSHPLTAIQFKLGTVSGVTSFAVNSISIENVYASGTAVMTPATAAQTDPKDRFTWTPSAATTTVSQNIGTQPTNASPAIGAAFLLIPQTFASTSTARIKISCTIDGKTVDLYQKLTSGSWKAGYTNEYTIGIDCSDNEALTGLFSVSSTKKVVFSKGNLQYQAATGAWRFAEKQYDVIGNVAGNTTLDPSTRSTQSAWIDFFSWGATGRTDINPFLAQPYYNSTQSSDFKTIETAADGETLTRENGGDWGVCMGSDWRTLSAVEWRYLFGNSTERSGKYNSAVTVCGLTNCIVLAPDNYTGEIADSYDVSTWSTAEASGLVCLPSNGSLSNANDILEVVNEGTRSFYWSSTGYLNHYAYALAADDGKLFALDYYNSVRCASHSVRLVKDAN